MSTQKELVERAAARRAKERADVQSMLARVRRESLRPVKCDERQQRIVENNAHRWARDCSALEKEFDVLDLRAVIYKLRIELHPLLCDRDRRAMQRIKCEEAAHRRRLR